MKKVRIRNEYLYDLEREARILTILDFRGVFMRDTLPPTKSRKFEAGTGIVNLDSIDNRGTHWVAYRRANDVV